MSKQIKSKLDPFAETLLSMNDEGKTLGEIVAWLKQEGVSVSFSRLSEFLESLRSARSQKQILGDIVSGSAKCREIDEAFRKNPAPELESIIKLLKVLIMQLATSGLADKESLKLADQFTRTALEFISGQTKAIFKEREVSLAEDKAAEAKKSDQQKALELCLDEAKQLPEVQQLFKAAFAALAKAKAVK
jgi:hypothetical protein